MATIAEERAANARARAEGYESAAHKEAHANVGASAAGYANAVQQEIAANRRAQAAGFANAAEQEMDANRRSIAAGFTSAVDQEIDANRRAREAGFLNAADLETYGAAGATRSTDPFVDPRTVAPDPIPEQFAIGTANNLRWNPNQPTRMPAVPTGPRLPSRYPVAPMGYPSGASYPNAQDAAQGWAGEMGFNINPRGGLLLRPWEAQSWQLSGIDPSLWDAPFARSGFLGGGGYPGGVPGIGGGVLGPIGGGAGAGGTKYPGVIPGSDKEQDLDAGRTHHPEMYDINDAWVGAEGTSYDDQGFEIDQQGRRTGGYINDSLGIGNKILGWMGADPAEVQRTRAIMADADMDVAASVGAATQGKYGTGGYQGTGVNAQPSGLLATNPYANNPYGSFPTGQNPSAHGARWEEIDPYGIDAGGTSGYDVAAGYRAYDNAMNAAARRTAAAGGVPWGSDYANRMGALSSSNQAALDAAAFHASLTGMPNLANIATAPTIVSANPASVWGDYMDEVETEAGGDGSAGRGSFEGMDAGYAGPR